MSFNWILSEIVLNFSVVKTEHAVCPKIFPMPHIKHSIITIKHAVQLVRFLNEMGKIAPQENKAQFILMISMLIIEANVQPGQNIQ